jgi:hypothetical protein
MPSSIGEQEGLRAGEQSAEAGRAEQHAGQQFTEDGRLPPAARDLAEQPRGADQHGQRQQHHTKFVGAHARRERRMQASVRFVLPVEPPSLQRPPTGFRKK